MYHSVSIRIFYFFKEWSMNECVNVLVYWMHVIRLNAPQRCAWQKKNKQKNTSYGCSVPKRQRPLNWWNNHGSAWRHRRRAKCKAEESTWRKKLQWVSRTSLFSVKLIGWNSQGPFDLFVLHPRMQYRGRRKGEGGGRGDTDTFPHDLASEEKTIQETKIKEKQRSH